MMQRGRKTKGEQEFLQTVVGVLKRSPEQAVGIAERFTTTNPSSVWGKLVLADVQQFLGRRSLAKKLYREVLSLDPQNPDALTGLALMPGTPGKEAVDFLRKAAENFPSAITYRNLAFKLWETGSLVDAAATFEVLRSMGQRRKDRRLVIVANRAIEQIRKGEPPIAVPYSGLGYDDEN
ncbi:MAG: hypothetical protein ONB17_11365 [candidate division KSB1 bacterium]|nr:hypothetical protein [candidate division KSB1 bacterium]